MTIWEFLIVSFLLGAVIIPFSIALIINVGTRSFYLAKYNALASLNEKFKIHKG